MKELENGLLVPENPKYADQRTVFNDLGQGVLDNAVQGIVNLSFHMCTFIYKLTHFMLLLNM